MTVAGVPRATRPPLCRTEPWSSPRPPGSRTRKTTRPARLALSRPSVLPARRCGRLLLSLPRRLEAESPRRGLELRKTTEAQTRSWAHTPNVLSAVTPTPTREQRLWSEEAARVFAKAATLEPAVRLAVRTTLQALADDPSTDVATRADVVAMLSATTAVASSGQAQRRRSHLLERMRHETRPHAA